MKNWQIMGILAVLVLGIVLMSGCTNTGSTSAAPAATPTPQIVYVTVLVTPAPTVARAQDPIIGVWRVSRSDGYDERYRFNADGTFEESSYFVNPNETVAFSGTWSAQGGNSYALRETVNGRSRTIVYDPVQKGIYDTRYITLLLTPYQGNVTAASTVPVTVSTPTPALKTVLFSDDFSHWRSEWNSEFDHFDGKIFYSGGSLHIRDNTPPLGTIFHTLNENFDDFILDVDTKLVDGTIDDWQGVSIRARDDANYYGLDVSADGYYTIVKVENGNLTSLIEPTRSSYIKKGVGATNHIHVEANKNIVSLTVNGHHLSTVTDNTFRDGTVNLRVNSKPTNSFSEVVFNNLTITSI